MSVGKAPVSSIAREPSMDAVKERSVSAQYCGTFVALLLFKFLTSAGTAGATTDARWWRR